MCKKKTKRMDKPDDALIKRQVLNTGDILHKFHELPGEFIQSLANEYPDADGGKPRVDGAYIMRLNGKLYTANFEDDSVRVDDSTLQKSNRYRRNLEYFYQRDVISIIRTSISLEDCSKTFAPSPTLCLCPWIISLRDYNGHKRLSNITTKVNREDTLDDVEALNIVMIPKMFSENQEEILEKVCDLFPRLKVEDQYYKCELTLQLRCVIHKFAKTIEDIDRLEGVIGLQQAMSAMEYQKQQLINQGIDQGIEQGSFDMALKVKQKYGIEEAIAMSGFSREELESGKLNGR